MSDKELQENKELQRWMGLLTQAELPVLKQTVRDLTALRQNKGTLDVLSVNEVVGRDPMMTVKLLRYLQQHRRRSQTSDVILTEQALLMIGLEPFFNKVPPKPMVEELFKSHLAALPPMLRVIHRAQRAAEYAKDWAVQLRDLRYDEVRTAALLHDIAEILMWCFAPRQMLEIHGMQQKDKAMRSRDAQQQVLGFTLLELQHKLVTEWGLPELLLVLMDDANANQSRVRNVVLAVNLARHSANGWDDAALPDDYRDIGGLLRMPAEDVMVMLGVDAGIVCDLNKPH